jgi:hypothetical protein
MNDDGMALLTTRYTGVAGVLCRHKITRSVWESAVILYAPLLPRQ